jgi:F-type H+-transporting ATPase subunit gamma
MSAGKEIRSKIKSVQNTQKITKAMHVVSAAKLKKIKDQASNLNEYSAVLADIINDISSGKNLFKMEMNDRKFFNKDLEKMPHLFIVMTSERGLCGAFNSTIIRAVKKDIAKLQKENHDVRLLVIGNKGKDALKANYSDIIEGYYHNNVSVECLSRQIKNKIIDLVKMEKVGACYMYFNRFKNAMTQILTKEQLLPAKSISENNDKIVSEYEYEGENLVHELINLYITGEINYGLLQNKASEEGARMTAMDNATKNAGELVNKLTLKLNRSRQAAITTELTEIISGAEAV